VDRVVEIVRVSSITRVPQAPEHVRGVQSLRGSILPVLEVKTRLGMPPVSITSQSRIVVAEGHGRLVGLLVDAVLYVARVPGTAVHPPPSEVRTRCSDYVVGIVEFGAQMALLLDIDRLLILPSLSDEAASR
jgi:purine-binding chemotaxis protein CheW